MRLGIASLLFLGMAGAVWAEGLPPEGPIDSVFTWTERQQTIPTAGGMEAFTGEELLVVTAASPGSVLDKLAARCLAMGQQSKDGAHFEQKGSCTFSDIDGDHIFDTFEITNGTGTGKLVGGTGKFAGITGEYALTSTYFGSPADGVAQGVGRKKGAYKITK